MNDETSQFRDWFELELEMKFVRCKNEAIDIKKKCEHERTRLLYYVKKKKVFMYR